jgi:rubrerythrin
VVHGSCKRKQSAGKAEKTQKFSFDCFLEEKTMQIKEWGGRFVVSDFNEVEAYKISRKIESDGIAFYQSLLEKAGDRKTKETLEFLLQEEKRHLKFFENQLFLMREEGEESYEDDEMLGSMDYGIFPKTSSEDTEKMAGTDAIRTFGLGIVMEKRSIQFYEACSERVSDKKTVSELEKIIQEETKHKQILEDAVRKMKPA